MAPTPAAGRAKGFATLPQLRAALESQQPGAAINELGDSRSERVSLEEFVSAGRKSSRAATPQTLDDHRVPRERSVKLKSCCSSVESWCPMRFSCWHGPVPQGY